eukprot:gnl/TRDRNA2_/TRDRNA2_181180_c0_seq1.p1 gnl/TRDRNA2_/TRDRNA2_181180_c0~~gnl/TRDRNA2_/TRDRNA2_181180_c0_seq1.p1  ORF type:complete len:269 (+),score=38.34 gnl/TRDRNA2_/TRDRNA2_181180_c0_seq1:92-898(+)
MAAGISVHYDLNGGETADLVHNSWPRRPGELPEPEFGQMSWKIGQGVRSHAGQSYSAPVPLPAGQSKRISSFYQKTGVLEHRTEPGFRDTKGISTLTELPINGYGTLRQSMRPTDRMPNMMSTGSMVLRTPGATNYAPAPTIMAPEATMRPPPTGGSGRSAASRRSNASAAAKSDASRARSQGSVASRQSRAGSNASRAASETPSWYNSRGTQGPWDFNQLPMYERTNETYGKEAKSGHNLATMHAAGKSESGFLEPHELVARLTRAG